MSEIDFTACHIPTLRHAYYYLCLAADYWSEHDKTLEAQLRNQLLGCLYNNLQYLEFENGMKQTPVFTEFGLKECSHDSDSDIVDEVLVHLQKYSEHAKSIGEIKMSHNPLYMAIKQQLLRRQLSLLDDSFIPGISLDYTNDKLIVTLPNQWTISIHIPIDFPIFPPIVSFINGDQVERKICFECWCPAIDLER